MSDDEIHDDEQPIRSEAYGYFRDEPLDSAARKAISKQLPDGAELVEGNFAADEKWRVVHAEQDSSLESAVPESPAFASCPSCGKTIYEHEPRISDHRGSFHAEHYEAVEPTKKHLAEMYGELEPDDQKRLGYRPSR